MKKALVSLLLCLPTMVMAQNTLTPEQQLEQAQTTIRTGKGCPRTSKSKCRESESRG